MGTKKKTPEPTTIPGQHSKSQINLHTEIIIDPFAGRDENHERLLATTRKAAFRTMPYMIEWIKNNLEDRFDQEITITAVMGQLVLSSITDRGLFSDKEKTLDDLVAEVATGIAAMVFQLLSGQTKPQEDSRIVKPTTKQALKLLN